MRALGPEVAASDLHPILFPFQRDLTRWAIRKGRAALFADTGLGKTFMQLEWARLSAGRSLIVAPLSVARQTAREAAKLGLAVTICRTQADVRDGINVTNYEMIEHFDPSGFGAVVLDESSILKAMDGSTRRTITEMFANTERRLCCTATPAPNDIAELANHAEFLGIMTRAEMLSAFFVHESDTSAHGGWRLKGHAEQAFYRWLASWGMSIRFPSDLGYGDDGFVLPELSILPRFLDTEVAPEGQLFFTGLHGVGDRAAVRKATTADRVAAAAALVNETPGQWILWCGLNGEADACAAAIPGSVNVQGSDNPESKAAALEAFQDGTTRVLVTKPRIAGFGMNFQNCHQVVCVGLSDSWESYYQCVRRCWRFGQTSPVSVHIILAEAEQAIWQNVMRKESEAKRMADNLVSHIREFEREEIGGVPIQASYEESESSGANWQLLLGDSCERLREVADESVDLSIFSPPFASLYTYSPSDRDLGNSRTRGEFFDHFAFIIKDLLRVTKPGRNCCIHVQQLPLTVVRDGVTGMDDFRGDVIRAFRDGGWIYHGEICIDKDPQAQAIRTHSKGLLFVQLRRDSSWLRPALADYIVVMRKPGENSEPIHPDINNEEWIEWARPIWYGIKESDTLNARVAREEKDERHVCPLQLGTIERCVRLWSNPGDLVLSPFAGIGSEGYVAVKHGRRFVGIELKRSYWQTAIANLKQAAYSGQGSLFEESAPGATGAERKENL